MLLLLSCSNVSIITNKNNPMGERERNGDVLKQKKMEEKNL